ncbi:hypothetical protein [Vibrio anguillarum]|uniref:Uncharacterized protein n=3 Tax=Vibrio anguillarum TaxID=55601 RepID=A0A1Y0NWD4_VIBAN|nr:hypothetical protein [Vibrio anguillarum]AOT26304.1 hypothetical protein Her_0008 [Vibrio phage Her]AOT26395.1 hypothetical protein CLA_0008 [Vibrio phage Cla]AOT26577.1 hypothetical protein Pel_0008 [Vibrio phage Pel]AOT26668.1 hypothetical protein pVa2_0007 [Vibrio phage pVa-2]AOT26759.1 hypothetical protein pVa1_0008 [Vibrio phage pVa-1]AOT26850.1 hypothetical protein pVa5_0008 [Vibrio phage vB_VspP_pVa5_12Jun]AOT26941.1 hypothetical protein pVa6_0008 [Vibrio phage pVa-6]AOT27037.1 hy
MPPPPPPPAFKKQSLEQVTKQLIETLQYQILPSLDKAVVELKKAKLNYDEAVHKLRKTKPSKEIKNAIKTD